MTENNIAILVTDLKTLKNFACKIENCNCKNDLKFFEMIVTINSVMFEIMSSEKFTTFVLELLFILRCVLIFDP